MPDKMHYRDSAGNTWTEPIPKHVQVEMAACLALDQLGAALSAATGAMEACRDACEVMATEKPTPRRSTASGPAR